MRKWITMNMSAKWAVGAVFGMAVFATMVGGAVKAQSPTNAPGRFQMLIIPPPASNPYAPSDVVILDTQEGELWKYNEYGTWPKAPESGSTITYLGKAKPGSKPGDVVDKYVHSAMPAPRTK